MYMYVLYMYNGYGMSVVMLTVLPQQFAAHSTKYAYMWSEWTAILPCKGYMYNTLSLLVHDCIDEQQEAMLFLSAKS